MSFDARWNQNIYDKGLQLNQWPSETVVSTVYRLLGEKRWSQASEVKVLDIGCGAGNNSFFMAQLGMNVSAFDGSETVIKHCQEKAQKVGLQNIDFFASDLLEDKIWSKKYDFILDRCCLTHNPKSTFKQAMAKSQSCLSDSGVIFAEFFSNDHSAYRYGQNKKDGLFTSFTEGYFENISATAFYSQEEAEQLFSQNDLKLKSLKHVVETDCLTNDVHAVWRALACI